MATSDFELRLLGASLSLGARQGGGAHHSALFRAVELIEQGRYSEVLDMDAFAAILKGPEPAKFDPFEVGAGIYEGISRNARNFSAGDEEREMLIVAGGIASLLIFLQVNFTGPETKFSSFPFRTEFSSAAAESWDTWARGELMVDGCDMIGKCMVPQYLLMAIALLGGTGEDYGPITRIWWASRSLMAQQQVLNERSPTLMKDLKSGYSEVVRRFGSTTSMVECSWHGALLSGEEDVIAASAYLEAALVEFCYRHVDDSRLYLDLAESFAGLKYSVEGAMGYRRQFQADAKAQLVLRDEADLAPMQERPERQDGADVLLAPRLVEGDNQFLHEKALTAVQQAAILARCLYIKRTSAADELRGWKMAPYMEAVDAQETSPHMIKACCRLHRVEWEKSRAATQQRAFLTMETIVADIRGGSASVSDRMRNLFCLSFPCIQELFKNYANMLVSVGSVGEALKLFEELEMWHSLIDCHRLLGDKARAASLIKDRVAISPNDPRLWCSLGDVTDDESCFVKSWEVSRHRFVPAQRCLARSAYNRKDYVKATEHWDLALALNPLNSDGWFSLGFAAMKSQDMDKALNAFVRAVQLDPENGEAWNNIAALNMRRERYKEANVAFHEALKFKRDSWQMWMNFAHVSFELGSYTQAVVALDQAFELSQKNFNLFLLTRVVEVLEEEKPASTEAQSKKSKEDTEGGQQKAHLTLREAEQLSQILGKLISKVALSGHFGGEIWGLKARWHKVVGEDSMCIEALVKQVRAYQGSDWQHDKSKFRRLAGALQQLSEAYLETGGSRELYSVQLQLRSTLKQTEDFENTEEYKALKLLLEEVQSRLS